VEYRGVIPVDPLALLMGDGDDRRFGWGRRAQWVVFLDTGRGWLVGPPGDGVRYRRGSLPPLGTFRTDIGFGLRLDPVGLYLAKAVSQAGTPLRFFVRLSPRF
jgi:hypothetical protein